ncbi:MAG: PIN domain-containing protein [Thermoanaerobaculia bacterium]
MILVDTGPLVALLDRSDPHHGDCLKAAAGLPANLSTIWPVLTEAQYLLSDLPAAQDGLWKLLLSGRLGIAALDATDLPRIEALLRKYRDLPLDLADAALVRVAERERIERIFTLDRRHFSIVRPQHRRSFDLVP